ncbi:DUF1508 domain-containing protein [Pseudolysinimonas sp.]|uniref:DUF1508 domain-containing protein n=1 Tax=Pseudolysinimonas sp. TaxID=2680009 RepID=UPI003F8092C4
MSGDLTFHIFRERRGYIWTVNSRHTGDVIATSELYPAKELALRALEAIRREAVGSDVTDHTAEADGET